MKVVSSKEMKELEGEAILDIGIPSLVLMESASSKFTERCFEIIKNNKKSKIVIFAGKGNNGGDGLAFARHIYQKNCEERQIFIEIIFIGDKEKATPECNTQLNILYQLINRGFNFNIHFLQDEPNLDILKIVDNSDLIVDAIIGTGLEKNLRPDILKIVDIINKSTATTVSVDCPTGVNSDNGNILGDAIKADFTVTFHLPKIGLLINDGALYSGKVFVEDIKIPYGLEKNITTNTLTLNEAKKFVPKRPINGNKGTFGKVFIFAGCDNMAGAGVISATATYKTGAGLVYLYSVNSVCQVLKNLLPEAITNVLKDENGFLCKESLKNIDLKNADVIVLGPGIGQGNSIFDFVKEISQKTQVPIIIDADGLNAISNDLNIFNTINAPCIITPHIGEMARLIGKPIKYVKENILQIAKDFSAKYNVIVLLKDFRTIIANPKGEVYINTTGSSALAKGGSGDCLTGVIASLIAQGIEPFYASVFASYIFGLSAERLSQKNGEFGILARDVANFIPTILKELQ